MDMPFMRRRPTSQPQSWHTGRRTDHPATRRATGCRRWIVINWLLPGQ